MWVVKLGGSLIGSPALKGWLDAFTQFGDGKVVIVPGGGLLADAVREAQSRTGVNDAVAHEMAVVAMDQYAALMTGLNPHLAIAASELEIAECGWQHRAILWKPSPMVLADEGLPKSWELTSDSLAAWLAHKLGAQHLLIVKSYDEPPRGVVSSLQAAGVVDAKFAEYIAGKSFKTWLLAKNDYVAITHNIAHEENPPVGTQVLSDL